MRGCQPKMVQKHAVTQDSRIGFRWQPCCPVSNRDKSPKNGGRHMPDRHNAEPADLEPAGNRRMPGGDQPPAAGPDRQAIIPDEGREASLARRAFDQHRRERRFSGAGRAFDEERPLADDNGAGMDVAPGAHSAIKPWRAAGRR